jgi:hypothetical protein
MIASFVTLRSPSERRETAQSHSIAILLPSTCLRQRLGDVFSPYGDADPVEAAFFAALGAQLDERALLEGVCGERSRLDAGA